MVNIYINTIAQISTRKRQVTVYICFVRSRNSLFRAKNTVFFRLNGVVLRQQTVFLSIWHHMAPSDGEIAFSHQKDIIFDPK